jgi:hypothetical protein
MTSYRLSRATTPTHTPPLSSYLGGIPKNIYQSLHNRLKRCVKLPVISLCSSVSGAGAVSGAGSVSGAVSGMIPNLTDEVMLEYFHQEHQANDDFIRKAKIFNLVNAFVRLGNGNHHSIRQFSTSMAWCFQTWWGHPVCITIQVSKLTQSLSTNPFQRQRQAEVTGTVGGGGGEGGGEPSSFLYWSGWMEIQCDDISTLTSLKQDAFALIQFLTHNLLQITSPSSLSSSSISATSSKGMDIISTHSLSQANGLFPLIEPSQQQQQQQQQQKSFLFNLKEIQSVEEKERERKKKSMKNKIRDFILQKFQSELKSPENTTSGGGVSLL